MHMRFSKTTIATATIIVSGQFVACTTDSTGANEAVTGGSSSVPSDVGGSAGGGTTSVSSVGGSTAPTTDNGTCAVRSKPISPTIATFDTTTCADTASCSITKLGGTQLTGGLFQYNDGTGNPVFAIVAGPTGNAVGITSTEPATGYGGGFGIWTRGCFDASNYTGISFWARGIAPNGGNAIVKLQVAETTPQTTAASGNKNTGTCPGDTNTCKPPSYSFPLTDTWTQQKVKWADFSPGDAAGTPVQPNGNNLYQIQWEAGLLFAPDTTDPSKYVAVPAPYDLQIDDVAFE